MKRRWTRVALLIGGTIAMTQTQMEAKPGAAMGGSSARQAEAKTGGGADAIRPFRVHFPDEALSDMKRRIAATRWPEKETVADTSQGVPLAPLQDLARYWATDYDWRKCEAKLNALPQFRARCPSSSRTDGPARSSSRSSWSARSPTRRPSAAARRTPSTS